MGRKGDTSSDAYRIYLYSAQKYDQALFGKANTAHGFELAFTESPLNADTARLASGAEVICAFVNDILDADCLRALALIMWICPRPSA